MKISYIKQSWILGWCLLFLIACQPTNISQSTVTQTIVAPSMTDKETTILTPTIKSEMIITSTPTITSTSTQTPTPSATVTPSPDPTLSSENILATIAILYETNHGCLLPCWWGFTPGQTDWIIAKEFLLPLTNVIYEPSEPLQTSSWSVEVHLPNTYYTGLDEGRSIIHTYLMDESIVQAFEVSISEPSSLFTPASILNTYGMPEEIYLKTWLGGTGYLMTFFYSQFGFRIIYQVDGGTNENGFINACFEEGFPSLTIWTPERELSFIETFTLFQRENSSDYYQPLDIATGMDVPKFYETFRNPDIPICLETPTEIWPGH